jgi:hypothetical protein
MAGIDNNGSIARRWFALLDAQRIDDLSAMTAPTWTLHGGTPALPAGSDGLRAVLPLLGPRGGTWTIEDMRASGDRVLVHATHALLLERFPGSAGSGRWQLAPATFVHRIADGRILETWRVVEEPQWVLELGTPAVPAGPACAAEGAVT